jgi:exodeoxyribonuclease VII large subunit
VSQLIRLLRRAIEGALPRAVAVEGEITNFTHHRASGHMYFALRDSGGLLRCVMFRSENQLLRFRPRDGLQVEAHGLVTFYSPQGQLQIQVDALAPAGRGALIAAFEALKEKLSAEGVFADARKRALPRYPRAVGLVTSPSGAALRDFVRLLRRRAPGVRILLAPARVQGEGAAASLVRAIQLQNRHGEAEVLIVGRGGGALEDLWAFNEEAVVQAIVSSRIPVVSAVGHESDITLADLVADARASTPSHAAEMVVEETRLVAGQRRLTRLLAGHVHSRGLALAALKRSYAFRRPRLALRESAQRLDELALRLTRGLSHRHRLAAGRLSVIAQGLPRALDRRQREVGHDLERLLARLAGTGRAVTPARAARLDGIAGHLEALGPGQVLRRGYALVRRPDGELVTGVAHLQSADRLRLDLHDGHFTAEVAEVVRGSAVAGPVAPSIPASRTPTPAAGGDSAPPVRAPGTGAATRARERDDD